MIHTAKLTQISPAVCNTSLAPHKLATAAMLYLPLHVMIPNGQQAETPVDAALPACSGARHLVRRQSWVRQAVGSEGGIRGRRRRRSHACMHSRSPCIKPPQQQAPSQ